MDEKDRQIIAAVRSMGLFRTPYSEDEVSRVVAKAIRSYENVDDMIHDIMALEDMFPLDKKAVIDIIKSHIEGKT